MVNTVALAIQQKEFIEQQTAFKTGLYTGDMNVDCWSNDQWSEEFEKYQVKHSLSLGRFHFEINFTESIDSSGFSRHLSDNTGHHSARLH